MLSAFSQKKINERDEIRIPRVEEDVSGGDVEKAAGDRLR